MKKRLLHGILIGLLCAAAAALLGRAGVLTWIENPTWDLRVRCFARPSPDTDQIRLVFLDQSSLDWGREVNKLSWPWPRQVYADSILAFCRRAGAKAVVFDVVFSEPSSWGVDDDVAFADGIAHTPGFVIAAFFSAEQGLQRTLPKDLPLRTPAVQGLDAWLTTTAGRSLTAPLASLPVPQLATNATLVGNVADSLSDDVVIRRTLPFRVFDGRVFASLGLAAYLAAHPKAVLRIDGSGLDVDGTRVPLDRHGQVILRYRGRSQTHATVSVQAVAESEVRMEQGKPPTVPLEFFRDKYVFFGFTAPALFDLKASPTASVYPGVEVHATFLDDLLAGDFIRPGPRYSAALLALLMGIFAGVLGRSCRTGWQTALAFVVLLPIGLGMGMAAYTRGVWLVIAPATVATVLGLISATILNYAIEGRQKRFIKGAFRQYLSPVVIDELVKHPGQLKLGGETRELTIFFSDVKGFTGISESLGPEQLTALLNDYLTAMSQIVMEQGGTIDKYIGDAIVAFWNAPLDVADHARRAVFAAMQCQRKLAELRPAYRERTQHDLYCRIGVNTGPVVVGNMGSNQRFDYTFLGDAGNLASRLEGINKQFGTWILISESTQALLGGDVATREISRVQVVGRAQPVRIYEPMTQEEFAQRSTTLSDFAAALEQYYKGELKTALEGFTKIAGDDPPAAAYAKRCAAMMERRPAPWTGVWVMTEK